MHVRNEWSKNIRLGRLLYPQRDRSRCHAHVSRATDSSLHLRPKLFLSGLLPVVMTKRKKKDIDYSSASDFEPTPARKSVLSRRKRRSTTAQKGPASTATDGRAEASALDSYDTPHPRSRHLIAFPDLMRPSLLEWYSGAHEARGMPWRKPFDPSLDADARAQRAYEVRRQTSIKSLLHHSYLVCAEGLDIGDHASADTSRHCNSLLQPMDEQVSAPLVFCLDDPLKTQQFSNYQGPGEYPH